MSDSTADHKASINSSILEAVQIRRTGQWLYGESTYLPVDIISLDFDFWYEFAKSDEQLEVDEQPRPLNEDGVLYYYRFTQAGQLTSPTTPDGGAYLTVEEAMAGAQLRSPSPIEWTEA